MNPTLSSSRRYDLDWLRVILILIVLVFHSLHFFDAGDWHVKNATSYFGADLGMAFISRWMMPGIFIVSGVTTYYALGKKGVSRFVKDRSLRLLVPLLVADFTHAAWQVYLERISHGQFTGTFWQYYTTVYFNGLDRVNGDFRWFGQHLWYVLVLFVFSLVCLPLFNWLRHGSGQRALNWLGDKLSTPGLAYLMVIPTTLVVFTINPQTPYLLARDDWGGWSQVNYLIFFVFGFVLASSVGLQAAIRKVRWISLAAGILTFLATGAMFAIFGTETPFGSSAYFMLSLGSNLVGWSWLFAIFGFSLERLNNSTPLLDYANEAVLPFYILHQTVMLTIGFYAVNWLIPDLVKWILILLGTFVICMALYEGLIRRINLMRFLFGMKPLPRPQPATQPAAQQA